MEPRRANRVLSAFAMAMAACAFGCGIQGLGENDVRIRVENGSTEVFDEVTIFLPRISLSYSGLRPGETTSFVRVTKAYRIASAQVVMGQDTARLQVIDYVGEEPLDAGSYTYVLGLFEGNRDSLIMDLESGS